MSDLLRSVILGIVQGLTEFLPISSSGHLEILNHLLGSSESVDSDLLMIILAHVGTAFSILYVYRLDIVNILRHLLDFKSDEGRLGWKIAVSMIPAFIIGMVFESQLDALFSGSILYVGIFLICTGIVLYFTPKIKYQPRTVGFSSAVWIGVAQAIAILPGISRSGMTIATALYLKIGKKEAARFSFLMVLPIILGKVVLDLYSGEMASKTSDVLPIVAVLFSSFLVGVWACRWMVRLVQNSQIHHFAYYCFAIGIFTILLNYYG